MATTKSSLDQNYFNELVDAQFSNLAKGEHLSVSLSGEDTHYCRFNNL